MMKPDQYGWALPKRQDLFDRLKEHAAETERIIFQDKQQTLPIIRIPIEVPKYRILNGRTATLQQEWLAMNPDRGEDFFAKDPESIEVQQAQHNLLLRLVNGAGLLDSFKSGEQQEQTIILDSNGFVVNGNRRLCAWRSLYYSEGRQYGHFANIDVIVLPPCDDRAIDQLEAKLQVKRDIKDNYSWDAEALMMQDRKDRHMLTDRELADFYETREVDIKESLEMLEYASKYLEAKGKARHWSLVSDKYHALQQIVRNRKKLTSVGDVKLFEDGSFVLLDDPTGGRLYEYIPDLQKYLPKVAAKLLEEFEDQITASVGGNEDLEDLFGTSTETNHKKIPLAEIMSKDINRERAAEIIKDAVESERSCEKDKNTANHVLKMLQKANSDVQTAIGSMRADSTTTGIQDQITAIENGLGRIKDWLAKKHA
jgi:hypothetical protein